MYIQDTIPRHSEPNLDPNSEPSKLQTAKLTLLRNLIGESTADKAIPVPTHMGIY